MGLVFNAGCIRCAYPVQYAISKSSGTLRCCKCLILNDGLFPMKWFCAHRERLPPFYGPVGHIGVPDDLHEGQNGTLVSNTVLGERTSVSHLKASFLLWDENCASHGTPDNLQICSIPQKHPIPSYGTGCTKSLLGIGKESLKLEWNELNLSKMHKTWVQWILSQDGVSE